VYQHLKDLNNERLQTEDANSIRYNRMHLSRIFENRQVEEGENIFLVNSVQSDIISV